jgi:hypothetical protein
MFASTKIEPHREGGLAQTLARHASSCVQQAASMQSCASSQCLSHELIELQQVLLKGLEFEETARLWAGQPRTPPALHER